MDLARDFRDLLGLLAKHDVRFLVVGGYAMAVHGAPRYTKDLDLWIDASPANAAALVGALDEFGFGSLGLVASDFTEPDTVIQLGYEPNRVDLLTSIDGVTFAEAFPLHVEASLGEVRMPVIDRASLIKNKRAAGRPRDLADAEELEQP